MRSVGVDIGLSGAIALYDTATRGVTVWDMPTVQVKVGRTWRPRIDDARLLALARALSAIANVVAIEPPQGRKRQSAARAVVGGDLHGRVWMAFVACGMTPISVHPATWKASLRLRGDKEVARVAATQLVPAGAALWPNERDHDRAEATLIALYASRLIPTRGVVNVV